MLEYFKLSIEYAWHTYRVIRAIRAISLASSVIAWVVGGEIRLELRDVRVSPE